MPGDLATLKLDKPRIVSKVNQIGKILTVGEMVGGLIPQDAILLVIASIGEGVAEECFILGPGVMGWTYGNRLEEVAPLYGDGR